MFEAWGRIIFRRRRPVLITALLGVVGAAVWGTGVFGELPSAGGVRSSTTACSRCTSIS